MFGPAIALAIGAKFVPLRKPRKLPGTCFSLLSGLFYNLDMLYLAIRQLQLLSGAKLGSGLYRATIEHDVA